MASSLSNGNTVTLLPVPKGRRGSTETPKTPSEAHTPSEARTTVKTTVELPSDLWRSAKIRAMDDGVDLRTVLIRALERFLGEGMAGAEPPRGKRPQ